MIPTTESPGIMNEYKLGSVANLISPGKFLESKPKKLKKVSDAINKPENSKKNNLNNLMSVKKKINKNIELKAKNLKSRKRKVVISDNKDLNDNTASEPKKLKKELQNLNHISKNIEEETVSKTAKETLKKGINVNPPVKYDFTENTVFVGNIPITYDKQKTQKIFSKFGKIKSIRIRCVPIADFNMSKKVAAIKKKFNSNRNSLVAYVKYKSKDSAEAALTANGMVVEGHHIRVDLAQDNKERDSNKAVFVGGLPFDVEDDDLWELFQNCGKINSVRVIRDSHTSMGKGFGYVNFESTTSVELALQLDGQTLKKRTINVQRCVKGKNKNKLKAFGKQKSKEITSDLSKKAKKIKKEKKKEKMDKNPLKISDFQGRQANMKQKKKKKPSKEVLRKRKVMKILGVAQEFKR